MRGCRVKRVVTGITETGRSVFSETGEPGTVVRFGPGFEVHELWRLDAPPRHLDEGYAPASYSFEPRVGAIFRTVVIPPDDEVIASLERGEPWGANSPYRSTGDDFGLHRSDTLDLVTVVSGRVDLRLPDGQQERLEVGDVVVQRGAEHAWRNPGPDELVLSVVMFGTHHGEPDG
jgi:mannose-6-phosphate isomerase-like protein (cupin superfamily)